MTPEIRGYVTALVVATSLLFGCGEDDEPVQNAEAGNQSEEDCPAEEELVDGECVATEPQNTTDIECPTGESHRPTPDTKDELCLPQPPQGTPDGECPGGDFRAHPSIEGKGICLPEPPLGTPEWECPSGKFESHEMMDGDGVCLPRRPRMRDWDCPEHWTTQPLQGGVDDDADTFEVCHPPELPAECDDGKWPSLRDGDCVTHGDPCPEDEPWPSEQTLQERADGFDGAIVYAAADASDEGATGSRSAPFPSITDAISAAEAGDIVAVGTGTYDGWVTLANEIALVGACPSQTRLERLPSPTTEVVVLNVEVSSPAYVGHLTVSGGMHALRATLATDDAHLDMEAVGVEETGAEIVGESPGASASLRDIVVADSGTNGEGLYFTGDGQGELDGAWLHTPESRSIGVNDGFELDAIDIWSEASAPNTAAILVHQGGNADLQRTVLSDLRRDGLRVDGDGSSAHVRDLFISAQTPVEMLPSRYLRVHAPSQGDGAQLTGERVHIVGPDEEDFREPLRIEKNANVELEQFVARGIERPPKNLLGGVRAMEGANATLQEVLYRGGGVGLFVDDATVDIADAVVTPLNDDPRHRLTSYVFARESDVELSRTELAGGLAEYGALEATGNTFFRGEDLSIHFPYRESPAEFQQRGVALTDGADAEFERLFVEGAGYLGVQVTSSAFSAIDAVIRGTRGQLGQEQSGAGFLVEDSTVHIERFLLSDHMTYGMHIFGDENSTEAPDDIVLRDGIVDAISPNAENEHGGIGLWLLGDVAANIDRIVLRDLRETGVVISGDDAHLKADDLRITDVKPRVADELEGRGMEVIGAQVQGRRWWVDETHAYGLFVGLGSGVLDVTDAVVEHVHSQPGDASLGLGAMVFENGLLHLSRALIADTQHVGLWGFLQSEMELGDLVVAHTRGRSLDNAFGIGVGAAGESTITADRAVIEHNQLAGMLALADGHIDARDLRISQTLAAECTVEPCEFPGGGIGLSTKRQSTADLERFVVEMSERAALQITSHSDLGATSGLLQHNTVGVNIGQDNYSIDDAFKHVFLSDNQQNISTETIEMPSVSDFADSLDIDEGD